jgi:hypothetical protein
LLLVTYTDVGADFNQLLDVTVLTVIVVGMHSRRVAMTRIATEPAALALTVAIVWGAGTGIVLTQVPDIRATLEHKQLGYPVDPLRSLVGTGDQILSEDPYVPLSLGRDPVVLDPFMLLRLDRIDRAAVTDLVRRIEQKQFDYLVMITSLDPRNDLWWEQYHFGLRVVAAMRRTYVLQGRFDGYYVYRPAE